MTSGTDPAPGWPSRQQWADAARVVGCARDVTLLAHVNPDADALGSALALGLALHRRGARVRVSFAAPERAPDSLIALDVAGLLVPPDQVPTRPELLIACDTASRDRLGGLADRLDTAGTSLLIDHHATNPGFGTHRLLDPTADATVVLVLALLDELGVEIDGDLARCVYAGLVTDTSCFRRADGDTHRMAARLLAAGVDPEAVTRSLLDSHPFDWLRMLGTVLGRAELDRAAAGGHGLVHTVIRRVDAEGLRAQEWESVVDLVRTTTEADVAAVLKETGHDRWSVSLRSTQQVDVAAAAAALGGGGHRRAAGFSAEGSAEAVLASLRAALASG